MEKNQIKKKVIQFLEKEDIFSDVKIENGIEDADLETYGMDSLAFVQMIVKLEEEFKVEIPYELLVFDKWNTITKIIESMYEILE